MASRASDDPSRRQQQAPGPLPPTDPHLPASPPTPLPTLPGYELQDELGRGGMGVVYLARDVELKRPVAIKMILSAELADEQQRERFLREARAAAGLEDPGIARVYHVGTHQGRPFLVMEFVEGGSLAGKLRGQPVPSRQTAGIVAALARAVQAAHEAGIIHRDLKPANVLVGPRWELKIADFGLARKVDEPGLTGSGAAVGTPAYMAPEQARGQKDVGPAADVYSLGAVLYELLTGRPPFRAATAVETILQVLERQPQPPRTLNPKVERDLEVICLKCLDKRPGSRYASARALAADLERWLEGKPIRARPVGRAERLWLWSRRKPLLAGLAGMAAMLLMSAVVLAGLALLRTRDADQAAAKIRQVNRDTRQKEDDRQKAAEARKLEQARQARARQRRLDYRAAMKAAGRLAEKGQFGPLLAELDRWRPSDGETVECGWEWFFFRALAARSSLVRPEEDAARAGDGVYFTLPGHDTGIGRLDWSPDGKLLACGKRVIDAVTGKPVFTVADGAAASTVPCLSWSPDGQRLAWVGKARGDKGGIYDRKTGKTIPLKIEPWLLVLGTPLVWSPDGKRLAVAAELIQLWDTATGEALLGAKERLSDRQGIVSLAWTPAGLLGARKTSPPAVSYAEVPRVVLQVVNLDTRASTTLVPPNKEPFVVRPQGVAWSPNGKLVALAGTPAPGSTASPEVKILDARTGREVLRCRAVEDKKGPAADRRDGPKRVPEAMEGGRMPANGALLAWSPDGTRLAWWPGVPGGAERRPELPGGGYTPAVQIWNIRTGRKERELPATEGESPFGGGIALAWSPDGRRLVRADIPRDYRNRPTLTLYDTARGRLERILKGDEPYSDSLSPTPVWSPDGKRLACAGLAKNKVRVWEAATGEEVLQLVGHTGTVQSVQWSADGRRLITRARAPGGIRADPRTRGAAYVAGPSWELKVWDAANGEEIVSLAGLVAQVQFSPTLEALYTISGGVLDRSLTLWDLTAPVASKRDRPQRRAR
jgi:WD40 repeat protein/predicted Ser/Thr protein kinase